MKPKNSRLKKTDRVSSKKEGRKTWTVYIIECGNKAFYTGITNNLERRLKEHSQGRGARYTRMYKVNRLVYTEKRRNIRTAMKREREIKKLSRERKAAIVEGRSTGG